MQRATRAIGGLLAMLWVACATSSSAVQGPELGGDADARGAPSRDADRATAPDGPVRAEDACAQFWREQAAALSPEEHMRTYGCPPCPCSCFKGQITCAPCAACQSFEPAPEPNPTAAPGDESP